MGSEKQAIDLSPEGDGGIMKRILQEGTGSEGPRSGDRVEVHYVGKLESGSVFDSSRDRGQSFNFTLGKNEVIKGWDIGVKSMKRGEIAELVLRSDFAYGSTGSPPKIPPGATLVFEVELIDWTLEDLTKHKDGGVRKRVITEGSGFSSPNDGATVKVTVTGSVRTRDGSEVVFDPKREVCFIIGESSEEGLVEGVEIGVGKMKKGERAEIHISRKYGFNPSTVPRPECVPEEYEEVVYDVTVNEFEKKKEVWELGTDERVEAAELAKCKGTQYFKEGKYELALKQYKRIIRYIGPYEETSEGREGEGEGEKKRSTLLSGYLNLAMTYLKLKKPSDAIKAADESLQMDPVNQKGLFRRGLAYLALRDFELANKDFSRVLQLDPNNSPARAKVIECLEGIKEFKKKEKEMYKNMFDTFAKRDKEKVINSY